MGQSADSNRNAALDDQKARSAGRHARSGQRAPGVAEIKDAATPLTAKGKTGGAFGEQGMANRKGGVGTQGGGGGGGESSPAKDNYLSTGAAKRKTRKRTARSSPWVIAVLNLLHKFQTLNCVI